MGRLEAEDGLDRNGRHHTQRQRDPNAQMNIPPPFIGPNLGQESDQCPDHQDRLKPLTNQDQERLDE